MTTQHQITIDGLRLTYLEHQPQTPSPEPPLLLLHALIATAETFTELIAHLPRNRRIIALDLLSAEPANRHASRQIDVRFAAITHLIHGFIQALGLNRPIFIGHSHGGVSALSFAVAHPTHVSGLVLLAPAHPFGGYRSHVVNFYLKPHGRILALSIPLAPRWAILRAYNQAAGPAAPISHTHLDRYMRVLRSRNTLRRILQMLHTWEADMDHLRHALTAAPLPHPTLLIWGDADTIVPLTSAPGLQAHLQHSELVALPAMGHLLAEEAPQACAEHITTWLSTPGLTHQP